MKKEKFNPIKLNGRIYKSINHAADSLNLSYSALYNQVMKLKREDKQSKTVKMHVFRQFKLELITK